jgi:uncharacterized membrane protein
MNFQPIRDASLAIQIHLATVIPAFFMGTWLIFFSRKGARPHRRIGVAYLVLMTVTATAAIFIRELRHGSFSLLHLFVLLTYWGVFGAIWNLRRKNIRGHQRAMIGLYVGGLLIAGGLTFYPGRIMYRVFFGHGTTHAAAVTTDR